MIDNSENLVEVLLKILLELKVLTRACYIETEKLNRFLIKKGIATVSELNVLREELQEDKDVKMFDEEIEYISKNLNEIDK